jgi:hypothetical protein
MDDYAYSPPHLLTYSPTHLLTYSPLHLLTYSRRIHFDLPTYDLDLRPTRETTASTAPHVHLRLPPEKYTSTCERQMSRVLSSSSTAKSAQGKSGYHRTVGSEKSDDKGTLQIPVCFSKLSSSFTFYHFASLSVLPRSVLRSVFQRSGLLFCVCSSELCSSALCSSVLRSVLLHSVFQRSLLLF